MRWPPARLGLIVALGALAHCSSEGNIGFTARDTGVRAPPPAPAGVTFVDSDPACASLAGHVVIRRADDETEVTSYALYFGTSPITTWGQEPIAVLPKTGDDITYALPPTPRPREATHLLAFARTASGDTPTPAAALIDERLQVTTVGLAVGAPGRIIDPVSVQSHGTSLLVITPAGSENDPETALTPALFRCGFDGTGCVYRDISAGQGRFSGISPTALLDPVHGALLVVTARGLFRCAPEGVDCVFHEVAPNGIGPSPSATIDVAGQKLLIVHGDVSNEERPVLHRCNLDGTACSSVDISAGRGPVSGRDPRVLVDPIHGKMLVVTSDGSNGFRPGLFRCDLDGSGCTYADLSAGRGEGSGISPSAAIDVKNGKLLVVTDDHTLGDRPALFRCDLDGSGCDHHDVSAGRYEGSGGTPFAVIDEAHGRLIVLTRYGEGASSLGIFDCALDGSGCSYRNGSLGTGMFSGRNPTGVFHPSEPRLLAVTRRSTGGLSLHTVCLR